MTGRAIAERFLSQKLAGITLSGNAVGVYRHPAPTTATYPHITVALISAVDLYQMDTEDTYERLQYIVRVFDKGNSATRVHAVAQEINKRINHVEPTFYEGGYVASCYRVGAVAPDTYEEQNGEIFQVDGGMYRFHIIGYSE